VAIEFMDRPCIEATEAFAKAGYPMCEALLIVEVEGSDAEIDHQLSLITEIAQRHDPVELRESKSAEESAKIWLGRKSAFGAMGQINDYMCLDGTIPVSSLPMVLRRIGEMSLEYGLKVGNVAIDGSFRNFQPFRQLPCPDEPAATQILHNLKQAVGTSHASGSLSGEHSDRIAIRVDPIGESPGGDRNRIRYYLSAGLCEAFHRLFQVVRTCNVNRRSRSLLGGLAGIEVACDAHLVLGRKHCDVIWSHVGDAIQFGLEHLVVEADRLVEIRDRDLHPNGEIVRCECHGKSP
jgi:FAD/FMN-containing dehydrogenase